MDKKYRRHVFIFKLLWWPVTTIAKLKFNFKAQAAPQTDGACLILSNHNTDWDPFLVACSFKMRHMYYVASEHIFRWGWFSRFLVWIAAPIAKLKGSTDGAAAMSIIRALRRGSSVCLFAEGNRSWNGQTGQIHPTIGRLAKTARANLVTYRLTGGYLTTPRWQKSMRRGRMHGAVVNVYTPETLSQMTTEEIHAAVSNDLFEDAYETQKLEHVKFIGKDRAEKIETAFYTCPKCHGICTIHSSGSRIYCDCGFELNYSEYGLLEGEDAPFSTLVEWDRWQTDFLRETVRSWPDDRPIVSDSDQKLIRINDDHSDETVDIGELRLYKDRLVLGETEMQIDKISQISVIRRETVVFSYMGASYSVIADRSRSGRKYMTLIELLKDEMSEKSASVGAESEENA